jgi:hypothetical protein
MDGTTIFFIITPFSIRKSILPLTPSNLIAAGKKQEKPQVSFNNDRSRLKWDTLQPGALKIRLGLDFPFRIPYNLILWIKWKKFHCR